MTGLPSNVDAWLGLKELVNRRRVAIVSDVEKIRHFTDKAGHQVPGEYKRIIKSLWNISRSRTMASLGI
jgi:hypothetical protein